MVLVLIGSGAILILIGIVGLARRLRRPLLQADAHPSDQPDDDDYPHEAGGW